MEMPTVPTSESAIKNKENAISPEDISDRRGVMKQLIELGRTEEAQAVRDNIWQSLDGYKDNLKKLEDIVVESLQTGHNVDSVSFVVEKNAGDFFKIAAAWLGQGITEGPLEGSKKILLVKQSNGDEIYLIEAPESDGGYVKMCRGRNGKIDIPSAIDKKGDEVRKFI